MKDISIETRTNVLVSKYKFRTQKSLGQNFLMDKNFIADIIYSADLDKETPVIEIGPGLGCLTYAMAEEAGMVYAIEIDNKLINILTELFEDEENITVIGKDALKVDISSIRAMVRERGLSKPFKVVANLPYYITTPLIFHLIDYIDEWSEMIIMIQKEVAERIVASPGGKDYGVLSLTVGYYAEAEILFNVPSHCFNPVPKVDSAVIKLTKRQKPPIDVDDENLLKSIIKGAFAQRRKTLMNSLSNSGLGLTKDQWLEIFDELKIDSKRRGETLSIEEYGKITNLVYQYRNK